MKKILFLAIAFLIVCPIKHTQAAVVGEIVNFNVDPSYDATARSRVSATLVKTTSGLYFYVEKAWWDVQSFTKQNEILVNFDNLANEFSNSIYPTLTSLYGNEANPGIDKDNKITLLFESTNNNLGGYFRSQDAYSKLQSPDSNEREMLYLPIAKITSDQLKIFLAHEFVHLIEINQKEKLRDVQEEVWLSEARADYTSTLLGYDDIYEGSNLQKRVQDFLIRPNDSLTEWQGTKYDYAVARLFTHYLVDQYGVAILVDSLHSRLIGIPSINEALFRNGARENFGQVFTDWTIAIIVNDCSIDSRYCYLNKNLANLKINPSLIFLPLTGDSSLSMNNTTKNWSGNWQKIIGGNGDLVLKFSSFTGLNFQVPYMMYDKSNNYVVKFLTLDSKGSGEIKIKNFGSNYNSLLMAPSLQSKMFGFGASELPYSYTFVISITGSASTENQALIQELLAKIDSLKKQIAALQGQSSGGISCLQLNNNLYFGVSGADVTCLQKFLTVQGSDIYPEALVTGFFGNLTKAAVVRFQKKYEIFPTGFVGILTRQKINSLLR